MYFKKWESISYVSVWPVPLHVDQCVLFHLGLTNQLVELTCLIWVLIWILLFSYVCASSISQTLINLSQSGIQTTYIVINQDQERETTIGQAYMTMLWTAIVHQLLTHQHKRGISDKHSRSKSSGVNCKYTNQTERWCDGSGTGL